MEQTTAAPTAAPPAVPTAAPTDGDMMRSLSMTHDIAEVKASIAEVKASFADMKASIEQIKVMLAALSNSSVMILPEA